MIACRMAQPVMRRCDLQCRQVVVHAEVQAHTATARRGHERRERAPAVGPEKGPRRLDHQLEGEGTRLKMQPRLEVFEQPHQDRHFLGMRHLGQGHREGCGELPSTAFEQRCHEQLERTARPRGSLGRERLDPDAEEGRQAVSRQPGRAFRTSRPRHPVLLRIRADAEPILEIDPEILDRLAPELLSQAREHMLVDVAVERGGENRGVGSAVRQGVERQLAPLGRESRPKQVRADVRRMDRAAPGGGSHARFPQKSRRS